jgi:DNA (cytosine-5)-methyltransferase 1
VIRSSDGRHRRLTPVELERLNGFPDDWTKTGMPDTRRAFMMGNALVVGIVDCVGKSIADELALRRT